MKNKPTFAKFFDNSPSRICSKNSCAERPAPFLGFLELDSETSPDATIRVEIQHFLAFSFELAEDLADLIEQFKSDSIPNLVCYDTEPMRSVA